MYILDTDHLGILQRARGAPYDALSRRIAQHSQSDFYVTIVSFQEVIRGWNAYLPSDGQIRRSGSLKSEPWVSLCRRPAALLPADAGQGAGGGRPHRRHEPDELLAIQDYLRRKNRSAGLSTPSAPRTETRDQRPEIRDQRSEIRANGQIADRSPCPIFSLPSLAAAPH